jgi:hypothetical protein
MTPVSFKEVRHLAAAQSPLPGVVEGVGLSGSHNDTAQAGEWVFDKQVVPAAKFEERVNDVVVDIRDGPR